MFLSDYSEFGKSPDKKDSDPFEIEPEFEYLWRGKWSF